MFISRAAANSPVKRKDRPYNVKMILQSQDPKPRSITVNKSQKLRLLRRFLSCCLYSLHNGILCYYNIPFELRHQNISFL